MKGRISLISDVIHELLGMKNWKILANLETLNKCTRSISCYIHNFGYIGRNKKHRCLTSLSKLEWNKSRTDSVQMFIQPCFIHEIVPINNQQNLICLELGGAGGLFVI